MTDAPSAPPAPTAKLLRRFITTRVLGRRRFQRLFSALNRIALRGMNIGGGTAVATSGEEYVLELVAAATSQDRITVFDVGANVGDYAALVHHQFDGRADIHCFEPSPRIAEELRKNCGGFATINNFGLSDTPGTAVLHSNPERPGLSSVYQRKLDHLQINLGHTEEVRLETLDDYCAENRIDRIDLLKLDVEGHELAVLRGADRLLGGDAVDFIQFEFGGCNIDSRTYFRDFYELLVPRFRVYRILTDALWPVSRYDESLEMFSTTNYLAIRAGLDVQVK